MIKHKAKNTPVPKTFAELNQMLPLRPINDDVDLDNAIEVVDRLALLPRRNCDQEDYTEVLSTLIEQYEAEHYAINLARVKGIDVLRHLLMGQDMTASDLGRLLGDRALGSRILGEHRELSKQHIRTLCNHFHVSADLFI